MKHRRGLRLMRLYPCENIETFAKAFEMLAGIPAAPACSGLPQMLRKRVRIARDLLDARVVGRRVRRLAWKLQAARS